MPIYEYLCQACGYRMEKLQKMSDEPLKQCSECEKHELKKLVSAAAFRLKGSGWYETDFKSGKKKNLHSADASSKSSDSKAAAGVQSKKNVDKASSSSAKKSNSTSA